MAANAEEVAETQGGGLGAPRAFEQDEGAFGVALDGQSLQKAPRARTLMDLHDLCILQILKNLTPLPDLFHVALTNKRLQGLATGRRLFLVVQGDQHSDPAEPPTPHLGARTPSSASDLGSSAALTSWSAPRFQTIGDAIAGSRPGDTILLEQGTHNVPEPVRVPWPLHFIGDACKAEKTKVVTGKGVGVAFDFGASGKLTNLMISTGKSPCVLHRSCALLLDRCLLVCRPDRGLEHLVAPLVTMASGVQLEPKSDGGRWQRYDTTNFLQRASQGSAAPGILCVKETRIVGTGQAVRCSGTGCLQSVRVIYQLRDTLFWFIVDSAHPGSNPTDTINGQGKLIGGPRSIKDGPLQRPADPVEPETPDAQAAKRMRK